MLGPIRATVCAISLEHAGPTLIFRCAPPGAWPARFDIEIDCIAAV
jgi:hypothetical protein